MEKYMLVGSIAVAGLFSTTMTGASTTWLNLIMARPS